MLTVTAVTVNEAIDGVTEAVGVADVTSTGLTLGEIFGVEVGFLEDFPKVGVTVKLGTGVIVGDGVWADVTEGKGFPDPDIFFTKINPLHISIREVRITAVAKVIFLFLEFNIR